MAEEDRYIVPTISNSYIGMDENAIECSIQSWEMINAAFVKEVRREKKIVSFVGITMEREQMVFPHLRETFYSAGVQYDDIRLSGTTILEKIDKLSINAIERMEVKGEDVRAMVCLMSSNNEWCAMEVKGEDVRLQQIFLLFSIFHNNESDFKLLLCPRVKSIFYVWAYFSMK